jgi:pyruvate carboxylase
VQVRDLSVAVDVRQAERADVSAPGQVAAPFAGVVSLGVEVGQQIDPGATIATIEAMKMEATITSPVGGTVERLAIGAQQQVEGGDLLIVVS